MLIFLYVKIMENSSRQIIFQTSYILMPYLKIIIENQIFHLSTLNTSEWQSAKTVFSTFLQNGKTKIVHWCYYSDPYLVEASVTASGLLWCNVTSLANLILCISCWQTLLTPRCLVWTVLSGSSSFREVNLSNWIRISLKLSVNFDLLVFHPARRAAAASVPPYRDGPVQVRRWGGVSAFLQSRSRGFSAWFLCRSWRTCFRLDTPPSSSDRSSATVTNFFALMWTVGRETSGAEGQIFFETAFSHCDYGVLALNGSVQRGGEFTPNLANVEKIMGTKFAKLSVWVQKHQT